MQKACNARAAHETNSEARGRERKNFSLLAVTLESAESEKRKVGKTAEDQSAPDNLPGSRNNPEKTTPANRKRPGQNNQERPLIPSFNILDSQGNPTPLTLADLDDPMPEPDDVFGSGGGGGGGEKRGDEMSTDGTDKRPVKNIPFVFPTRDQFLARNPEFRGMNPHKILPAYTPPDPEGPNDLTREQTYAPNNGEYPAAVISADDILENVHPAVADPIRKEPSKHLAVVVFLGGWLAANAYKGMSTIINKVNDYLTRGGIIREGDVRFFPLTAKIQTPYAGPYTPPFAFGAKILNEAVREVLLGINVFPFLDDPDKLTVRFVEIDLKAMSWAIGIFHPEIQGGDSESAEILRWGIAEFARDDKPFRLAFQRATGHMSTEPFNERILKFLRTIEARYDERHNLWKVYGKPPTDSINGWELICAHIRVRRFIGPTNAFDPATKARQTVSTGQPILFEQLRRLETEMPWCSICSNNDHLYWCCEFPNTADWPGPTVLIKDMKTPTLNRGALPNDAGPRQNAHSRGQTPIAIKPEQPVKKGGKPQRGGR
ncbi:hypothetical protein MIND_01137400 [Mycena indigotica]|uniref:Uncharacterized protein n=1 Tax=Mycena indigotica TaxID=2126181 RepID=A0A8H6S643_9AGAR|nr:uncharacterized protein MIND_01137400 [Mycena indigotica]KAF7293584.1 hypothetical protein MIND_01137400 [Mycena indigotica]